MSTTYTVGIVGCGRPWRTEGATGFGMSHAHAKGYNATGRCRIVALCDTVENNARLFGEEHADGAATLYTDYRKMLEEVRPDIVSIATWPDLHAPMVVAAARAGVRAIHCEKPMADTWGAARAMTDACREHGVQLSFNHQRRWLDTFQSARRMVRDGVVGEVRRLEGACDNMMDWGTHWLNMFLFFNDETPADWVLGQVDVRRPKTVYGVRHDTHGVAWIGFANGVTGLLATGEDAEAMVGCALRIVGTDGWIELRNDAPHIRVRGKGDPEPRAVTEGTDGGLHGGYAIDRAIADVVDCLDTGRDPLLSVTNALPTTEIVFAVYESARRRGRIDLPLTIDDHPLEALIAAGAYPAATVP